MQRFLLASVLVICWSQAALGQSTTAGGEKFPTGMIRWIGQPARAAAPTPTVNRTTHRAFEPPEPVPADAALPSLPAAPLGTSGTDSSAGLTLAELEAMALANSPHLAQVEARIRAARGQWLQAGLLPNPVIGYVGDEMGNDGASGLQGAFVRQEVVTAGKLRLARAAAEQEIARREQQWAAQRLRILNDVRTGFYRTLIAQRRAELATQLVGISGETLETAQRLFQAQEVRGLDVTRARIERDQSAIAQHRAQNQDVGSRRRLAAVLGVAALPAQPLVGEIEMAMPSLAWQPALERLWSESPLVAMAASEIDRAAWEAERARADAVPNVEVQVSLMHDNSTGDDVTSVGVALPLPLFNRNQGRIVETQAELTAARHNAERLRLALQHRLASAFERFTNAQTETTAYKGTILPQAQVALDTVRAGYQAGEIGYLELLTAQQTYFETNLAYFDALEELWAAGIEIDGLLLNQSLGSP